MNVRALPAPRLGYRPLRLLWIAVGVVSVVLLAVVFMAAMTYPAAWDVHNYHSAWQGGLYDHAWFEGRSFVYAPVVAQLLWPFTLLPFDVFHALWIGLSIAALIYLVGLPAAGFVALLPPVLGDIQVGNVHLLLGAATALALSGRPGAWSFVLLTKVTPGVGIVWHLVRGEWRALAVTVGATAAISLVSFALAPQLWAEWIALLGASAGMSNPFPELVIVPLPLTVRLGMALLVTVAAARWSWPWLVPFAVFLALPTTWISGASILLASWRLRPPGTARNRSSALTRPMRDRWRRPDHSPG